MTAPRRSNRTGGALPDGRTKLYSKELVPIAHHKDEQHDQGQNIGHIKPHPSGEFQSAACVGLRQEAFPAPAAAGDAEQQIDQRSQRQDIVADNKVLQIHNDRSLAEGLDPGEDVKAQHTGHGQDQNGDQVDQHRFLPAPAPFLNREGQDVLKDRDHRGQSRKGHEHEKQGAPQPAHGHLVKDVGQGDENQVGARIGGHVKGKAGRENDQARRKGHKGIQHTHPDGLAGQGVVLPNVAAKDGQGANAQGEGEERLTHGGKDGLAQNHVSIGIIHQIVKVGLEIEFQALGSAVQGHRAEGQHHHHQQQAEHHGLVDLFHSVLKSPGADQHTQQHHDHHEYGHQSRLLHQRGVLVGYPHRIQPGKIPLCHLGKVEEQPAGHRGIKHHQQIVARNTNPAVQVPSAALGLQRLEGQGNAPLAGPAHRELHYHDRQAHDHQKQQVDQHKGRTAIFTRDIRKSPYVSKPDGAAC